MAETPDRPSDTERKGLSQFTTRENGRETVVIYSPENRNAWIQAPERIAITLTQPDTDS